MKTCNRCRQIKPLMAFYRHHMMRDGYLNFCKACVCERVREHRKKNDHVRIQERERYHSSGKRVSSFRRPPIASMAHTAVSRAINRGVLIRPDICEECACAGLPIEAAHFDYTRPLDVRWLCRRCHRRWDSREPKTRAA